MPASVAITVKIKTLNARGEWAEANVVGTDIEDFRPTINVLGAQVKASRAELFARRRYLGAALIQLRNRFARGTWGSFVASLGLNMKTVTNAMALVERLCDEFGELNETKVRLARQARPQVKGTDGGEMSLHQAERLAGIRDDKQIPDIGTVVPVSGGSRKQTERNRDIGTMVPISGECLDDAGLSVPDDDGDDDAWQDDGLGPFVAPDSVDASVDLDEASDDEWSVGPQMTFDDLRVQAGQRLEAARAALHTIDESKRVHLERVLRDLDALLT